MEITLNQLAALVSGELLNNGDSRPLITGVNSNSMLIDDGQAFVAIKGASSDGHCYTEDAENRGAAVLIVSDESSVRTKPAIVVKDTRVALSRLAAFFAGDPAAAMSVVGVTGTNGKTTINWMVHNLLLLLGRSSIRIGTLGTFSEGVLEKGEGLTTPDPITLHDDLRRAREAGVLTAVLEASSHSLEQHRVDDLQFDVGVYTNLTRDHLDYHGDMESYFLAKCRLFELLKNGSKRTRCGVVNIDCPYGKRLAEKYSSLNLFTYGASDEARLRISNIKISSRETTFRLEFDGEKTEISTGFIGKHNVYNLAAAAGAMLSLSFPLNEILSSLNRIPQVPGRLQYIEAKDFDVFVDYAHTPDALVNALSALRAVTRGRLWVLIGCGGDRDRGKRPQMAEAAQRLADKTVFTSDNPRTEDPDQILNDMLSTGVKPDILSADRREAIRLMISQAEEGDVLLVAGKGHEDYQILGKEKIHFSDSEEVLQALAEL